MKKVRRKDKSPIAFIFYGSLIIIYTTTVILIHGGLYDIVQGTIVTEIFSLLLFGFIYAVYRYANVSPEKQRFAFYMFLYTFAVQSASAIGYAFQAYRCNRLEEKVSIRQDKFLIQVMIYFVVFFLTSFLFKVENYMQQKIKKTIYIPITINLLFGIYFILTPGKSADIKGYIVGLPLMAGMILSFSIYHSFYRYVMNDIVYKKISVFEKISFVLIALSSLILILGYIHRHEYGIPVFFAFALILWIFFQEHDSIKNKKQKILLYGSTSLAILAGIIISIVCYRMYQLAYNTAIKNNYNGDIEYYVSNISIFHNLGSKVARLFLDTGTKFTQSSGIFGNSNFVYDIAANTDYAMALQIKNFGIVWLSIIVILLVLCIISGAIFLTKIKEQQTIFHTAKSLAYFTIIVLTIYPLLSNTGMIAIIGVSAYSAGYSIMNSILSAMLLSFVSYEKRR